MTMNIIDLFLLLILVASVIFSLYRGSVSSALGFFVSLLSLLLAGLFYPQLVHLLSRNKAVMQLLATYTDAGSLVGDYSLAMSPAAGLTGTALESVMKGVGLPIGIESLLRANMQSLSLAPFGLSTVNEYVSHTVVMAVIQSLSYTICFFLCFVVLHTVINAIGHTTYFPLLRHGESITAAIFGLLRGAVVVFVICQLTPIVLTVIPVRQVTALFSESSLMSFFYSNSAFHLIVNGV